ncbi:MAG TPA: CusA/CzcA family heavy metal efflux RND transporter, partial [Bacteroidales bacterium]|nr:CusA/CzcA family heavy metal efflux RND transporter [Bacteroidales bacterium]
MVSSLGDIEKIVIKKDKSGIPVLIRDIGEVRYGNATRYGAFVVDTTEAVGGVVMMLKGANAHEVIKNVESRISEIQQSLPKEVKIEPYLNRSDLVGRAIHTVSRNLIEGALIVIFILVLLLGNIRAGLIVASVIPLSMLFAVSLMNLFGVSGNLMSLGAIDFGLIVDGAVIIVESVVHRITSSKHHHQGLAVLSREQMDENVTDSAIRMMNSATFGQIIILIVYLPVMALVGIEGKMFRPMAQVVTFALIGAAILSLTYVPMASALFLSRKTSHKPNLSDHLVTGLKRIFEPAIDFALRRKTLVSVSAIVIFILSLVVFNNLGGEFIPQLEEGDLAAGVMTLQGGSITNTIDKVITANKILLKNFPEIKHTVCKIGAGEIPTDPTPMETGDYIITLKDKSEWTSAETREELVSKMEDKLVTLAGVKFEFQQPIQMRFNELMTGAKQDIAIKIFGDDLNTLAEKAEEIEKLIQPVGGVEDINVEKVTGLEQIQVEYNRDKLAQYGLDVSDVNNILRTAFAGSQAGVVYNQEQRFGLVVRLDRDYRKSIDNIKNLTVAIPGGPQIPLSELADIAIKSGPAQVSRENTKRRITVGFNVRNRDVKNVIADVSNLIRSDIIFPTGYYVTYGGQFKNLEAAQKRLSIAVPIALLLIFVLLYFAFKSVKQSLLIFTAVPMSAIGGILALWLRGMNFSISAGVGFIALFGVAVLNGIVLIAEFNRLEKDGVTDIIQRVKKGLQTRLRPVVMTASVASLGFLPMALSTSAGAEVQKPLATVVFGGLITATILTLVILPVFYVIFYTGNLRLSFLKKKNHRVLMLFFVAALSLFAGTAGAQDTKVLKLNDAIKIALDSNLAVKSAAFSTKASRSLKGAAFDLPKTSIDGQYGQFNSFTNDNSFSITQSFELPFIYINKLRLAKANIKSSELKYDIVRLQTATQVKQLYWNHVYLLSKERLLEYQDSLFRRFKRAAELRAGTGETNKLEMVTARSQSMELGNRLFQVRSDIGINSRNMMVLLNMSSLPVPYDTVLIKINWLSIPDSASINASPDLGLAVQQAEVSRIQKKIEKNQALPDISIGYFSQTIIGSQEINGTARDFGPGYRFTGVQAGISVPLWFPQYISRLKAARLNEAAALTDAEYYRQTLNGKLQSLNEELGKYSSTVDYYQSQAVPEAEMIIRQADLSYNAGALDYLDYVLTVNRALEIKQSYLDALNNYNQTVISIEYIYGKIF